MQPRPASQLLEVTKLFLKLGLTAFGGPAAHVAIMHDEVVKRRKWLSDQEFLDLLGATNLIPGPNSTEMAIHIGFVRAGWPGLIAGGLGFIMPAALIVLGLAWAYTQLGSLPQMAWLLYGIKPVVMAIIFQALWGLGGKALRDLPTSSVAVGVFGLSFWGVNEIALLFAGGLLVMLIANRKRLRAPTAGAFLILPGSLATLLATLRTGLVTAAIPFHLSILFCIFLKIGSVLYGSGYVLLAFLRSDLVVRYGWLSDAQLLDAIAIGQITPGPLFTTATFIGYQLGGLAGAALATLGIFLPSFAFVAISNPFIPRLRASPWLGALLDGVNAASLGLMAAVSVSIGRASLIDPLTVAIAFVSLLLLIRFKINSTWLIIGGVLAGIVVGMIK